MCGLSYWHSLLPNRKNHTSTALACTACANNRLFGYPRKVGLCVDSPTGPLIHQAMHSAQLAALVGLSQVCSQVQDRSWVTTDVCNQ